MSTDTSDISKKNVLAKLEMYAPQSAGTDDQRLEMLFQCANTIFPQCETLLGGICPSLLGTPARYDVSSLGNGNAANIAELGNLFEKHGSDKSTGHDYHLLYSRLFKDRNSVKLIAEIGLGTNNTDVVSNMGASGRPGASLRAFAEYFPNAQIHGADIDARILFQEGRITTHQVDQLKPETLEAWGNQMSEAPFLYIDDGLHAIDANINSLSHGLSIVRDDGWVVIEDVSPYQLGFWSFVSRVLSLASIDAKIISSERGLVFLACKGNQLKELLSH